MQDWDVSLRYIIVGEERVGKTSLLLRFARASFDPAQEVTLGVDFGARTATIDGRRVKILAWDTAGQERYRSIVRSYFRGAAVALLVYDVTKRSSLDAAAAWLEDVAACNGDVEVVLVGNKADAEQDHREVSSADGMAFAAERGLLFLEASAKDGRGVEEAFLAPARSLLQRAPKAVPERGGVRFAGSAPEGRSLRDCCP